MTNSVEGYLNFKGYKTWYVVHGKDNIGTSLIVVHGGPGYPHHFQNNLSLLANNGYPVVLYDQLGCGNSDHPNNPDLWTVELFVEELDALRIHLGFDKINLLGTSWGGSLALEYCLKHPANVNKLVLHSPLIDTKLWVEEADRLKDQLPAGMAKRMRELERTGDTNGKEYEKLSDAFNDKFVMRVNPKPQDYLDMINNAGQEVYNTMWGPSEAHATGTLKNWSAIDRLKDIKQKTLLISGKYDEATPKQMQIIVDNVPDIKWTLLENSSHCSNLEEPEAYLAAVRGFIGSSLLR